MRRRCREGAGAKELDIVARGEIGHFGLLGCHVECRLFEAHAAPLGEKLCLAALMLRDLMTSFRGSRSETLVHGRRHSAFAVIGPP